MIRRLVDDGDASADDGGITADSRCAADDPRRRSSSTRQRFPACRIRWQRGATRRDGWSILYSERIAALDRTGPTLRAVIELNPDAGAIADRLDAERRAGRVRGPLHGIPVLIKDNIDTADSMSTTAGSLALEGSIAARDAFLVTRLRDAGAVILGKTNLSEWANFRSSKSTSGWSGRGGQVKSPYVLDRNPCGSSSGSGTAAAANLATIAVGTETDGSIVCPSGAAALVGIKPTVGLVSRSGIIPISHTPGHRRPDGAHGRRTPPSCSARWRGSIRAIARPPPVPARPSTTARRSRRTA